MLEVLKNISIYVFKKTNQKLESSSANTKDMTNKLFALDLLKMSSIHMKYLTIHMAASKIEQFECPQMQGHINNLLALAAHSFLVEFRSEGYESGYFNLGTLDLIEDANKVLLKRIRP